MSQPAIDLESALLVHPFPSVGRLMKVAYRELQLAENGTPEQQQSVGDHRLLPRPWNPATCHTPQLRQEIWTWLDQVVTWLNHEYVWDTNTAIPSCWPQHPHLVHEIAALADQRRTAENALNSDLLEEWHRYSLPQFTERMRNRVNNHCDDGHQASPMKGRQARHNNMGSQLDRDDHFAADLRNTERDHQGPDTQRWVLVNQDTGETADL